MRNQIYKEVDLFLFYIYMDLFFAFTETDINTKFFFSSLIGVGILAFFLYLVFWLTNQKAMFKRTK